MKVPESGNFWPIIIAKLYCFDVNKKKHFISNINQLFGKTSTLYILKTKKTDVNLNDPDFAILDMELIPPRAKITIFGPQILIKRINWGKYPLHKSLLLLQSACTSQITKNKIFLKIKITFKTTG